MTPTPTPKEAAAASSGTVPSKAGSGSEPRLLYLSDEWLAEADRLVDGLSPVEADVTIGMEVLGGPDGDRRYRLMLGPDRVGVIDAGTGSRQGSTSGTSSTSGEGSAAGVRMRMSWEVATGIAQGRTSAQRAFLDGEIQLGGDSSLLLGHQEQLATLEDRLGDLRRRTDYG